MVSCKALKVGDKIYNRDKSVSAIILEADLTRDRYLIQFDDGTKKTYKKSSLLSKDISNRKQNLVKVGDVFKTTFYGDVVVLEYTSAKDVKVMFEDGVETTTTASNLRRGNVGHPYSGVPVGYTFTNKDGCIGRVVKYHSPHKVDVGWEIGGISTTAAANIKSGGVYCPNFKSVVGVGYFGYGKYKPNKSGGNVNYNERVYASWQRMLSRCYNEKEQLKPSCRAYKDVSVCKEWHNFQNFALWAEDWEDKFIDGWELDKDLFGNGKEYSPENCCLLPDEVNSFFSDKYRNKTSGLPEGVNIIQPKTQNSKTGFVARCTIAGKREYLGYFECPNKAGDVYRKAKEFEAKRLADKYKDVLTEQQYDKLYSFKIEDIHRK